MKEKPKKIAVLSPEFKEMFAIMTSRKEYETFVRFLKIQMNNVAIIEWFRLKSTDPDLARRKAYFEGQYDFMETLIRLMEESRKEKDD